MVCDMLDEIMEALADEHRRQLLAALAEENPEAPVQTPEGVQLGREPLDNLQIEMYHQHLPQLEEVGFIEWKKEEAVVVKGPKFEQIEPVLELFEEHKKELPAEWP